MADASSGSANRFRLLRAPWWLLSLYSGVLFGLLLWGVEVLAGADAATAVTTGVLAGLLVGPTAGLLLARRRRPSAGIADTHRAVLRAAAGGPVPADPRIRAAALDLAARQLAGALRWRRPAAGLLGLLTVLESAAALAYTPWLWVGAALLLVILAVQLRQPARLRRRIEELGPTDPRA